MDAFLAADARRTIDALDLISPGKHLSGFLLGHKRGKRYYIEALLPAPRGFHPNSENIISLDRLFDDRIIGFFSLGPRSETGKDLLQPFASGRMFLEALPNKRGLRFRASRIDYRGRFVRDKIGLTVEKAGHR